MSQLSRVQQKFTSKGILRSMDATTYRSSIASQFDDAKSRLHEVASSVSRRELLNRDESVVVTGAHDINLNETQTDEWHIVHQLQLIKDYERAELKKIQIEESRQKLKEELDRQQVELALKRQR